MVDVTSATHAWSKSAEAPNDWHLLSWRTALVWDAQPMSSVKILMLKAWTI